MTQVVYQASKVQAISSDISLLYFRPTAEALTFKSGQYVQLNCEHLSAPMDCSIAAPPQADGQIQILLRHRDDTQDAVMLLIHAHSSGNITLSEAKGHCTLAEDEGRVFFVAGGTGIAPHLAILKDHPTAQAISLFWGAREVVDFYCIGLLETLCFENPNFNYSLVLSDDNDDWTGQTGNVHSIFADNVCLQKNDRVYVSGPYEMVQAVKAVCDAQKLPPQQFFSDMFPPA